MAALLYIYLNISVQYNGILSEQTNIDLHWKAAN